MKHSLAHLRSTPRASRRAFTLIEILVVIAIIGLLSAILFPVFGRARENARKTACLSNMKQLGTAFQQYATDNGGKFPLAGNFQAWAPGYGHWVAGRASDDAATASLANLQSPFEYLGPYPGTTIDRSSQVEQGALFPYLKSAEVYVCPSNRDGKQKRLTYSMNCAVSGLKISKVRSSSDIVLLVDEQFATDGYFWAINQASSTDKLTQQHNGGGNLMFADGHAKFYTFESFPLDSTPAGLANKSRLTGSPRFHDRSFGSVNGSSLLAFQTAPGVFGTNDACAANPTTVTPPPAPAPPTTPGG